MPALRQRAFVWRSQATDTLTTPKSCGEGSWTIQEEPDKLFGILAVLGHGPRNLFQRERAAGTLGRRSEARGEEIAAIDPKPQEREQQGRRTLGMLARCMVAQRE